MTITPDTCVYIAGAGGMLGRAVHAEFSARCRVVATDIALTAPWISEADVRDYAALRRSVMDVRPDVILNLAALTDMEHCEREPTNAWRTNAIGAEHAALLAAELDIPHVYISTAGIFDGAQAEYHEFDAPHPLSVYARSKYAGEVFVARHVRQHFVVRAGWMMGGGPALDKKFVNKIYRQIAAGARELFVVDDKVGTPTYTIDFARGLRRLVESDLYGIYNQACPGACSRYDVACRFVQALGLEGQVLVTRVSSDHFREEYFAPRPPSERLTSLKLDARGLEEMREWTICLDEYAEVFRADLAQRGGPR